MAGSSAVSTNVGGVDVESGALSARTQDEGAVGTAARMRMPRAASLADRTAQRLVVATLGRGSGFNGELVACHGADEDDNVG
jgi:hypothetical protein